MAKKLIRFPTQRPAVEAKSLSRSHSRLILTIADRAFAFEFFSRVTELNRTPARILMFHRDKDKEPPQSRD